ncbi:hypothetical protein [Actinotalea sp. Marseille-Q4924]|uniref:hypothetical protein n=1 Tax=Actinotalea sp. Marseille-Q4924 TaxID=2866571 RepID=UPI001CE3C02E|nr:hypothetical protein [Actinotalea sp. Marseille-Q4924]
MAPRSWPWWLQVLLVAVAARAASAVVLLVVARQQAATPWAGAAPSYTEYVGLFWDASWYREIAEQGYPEALPRGADGAVLQNAWAFFPLFPLLVRPLLALGVPWSVAAPALATVLGVVGLLVVHRAVQAFLDRSGASGTGTGPPAGSSALPIVTVAVVATHPASPVLQAAYTESLALLLVAATLLALVRRRYGLVLLLVPLLGLTRAVALPMTVVVLAHVVDRARRRDDVFPRADRALLALAALLTPASGLLWPTVVGLATGEPDAYALTQGAWRGRGAVVPLLPWWDVARFLVEDAAPALLTVAALALVALAVWPRLRALGPEAWAWVAGYAGYLVVVLEPGTSLVRFSLLAFPAAAAASSAALARGGRARRTVAVGALVLVGLLGQVLWVWLLWRLVPPSGWPP